MPRLRAKNHLFLFVALRPKAVSSLRFATAVQNAGARYGGVLCKKIILNFFKKHLHPAFVSLYCKRFATCESHQSSMAASSARRHGGIVAGALAVDDGG
jgi:hypothetical protein